MECNKDEAVRTRKMAEARMQSGDFVDALRLATKAKKLYADVENITQILTICEVHNAANKKVSATDMDWYAILQIERFADEAIIKKQYRRLALLLHPDKNKYAGAEAAFKLIGQANGVLSDQEKRSLYDSRLGISVRGAAKKSTAKRGVEKCQRSSESQRSSHENVFTAKRDEHATNYQKNSYPNSADSNNQAGPTFWTTCPHCSVKFEYSIRYVNVNLLCMQCMKSFKAQVFNFGAPPPQPKFTSVNIQKEAPIPGPPKPDSESTVQKPLVRERTARFVRSDTTSMKKCAAGVGAHCEKSKDGSVPASKVMEPQCSKNVGSKRVRQSAPDAGKSFKDRNSGEMRDANVQENDLDHSRAGARRSSRKKQRVSYTETSEDEDLEFPSKSPRQNEPPKTDDVENKTVPATNGASNSNNPATSTAGVADQNTENVSESKEHNCPSPDSNIPSSPNILSCFDAEFNDFEMDKEADRFGVNQIWAAYDSGDAMPRFYAIVKKVLSPFMLKITWLEADPDDDEELDWQDADLPIACGKFRLGSSQKTTDRTMFSHQVRCVKETGRGSYMVYPRKGETWAIFRDWDINWSSDPNKHLAYDYDYVEILSDFSENVVIAVAYLGKVKGFVSLFQQTSENGAVNFYVRPHELYRFSHQIPSYKMSGNEREGVPRGSFEFDPAALPSNLFEVGDSGNLKMNS
ncbi:uncharacterized protein LOC124826947 [Vigna umbellata]|uniref:uncharacterized protein LOC124826947 n=1 Tax=Vigna umbellata TaxID=87088 RepID=UPI001F5EFE35|nr:uncharacterized protein LOC124826947 [Vigna umbellata]